MSETNWYVLTGAPSSGKTTLLLELEKCGYRVVHEVARAYIEKQKALGKTLEQIREDKRSFEIRILDEKTALEEMLPKDQTIIFDRAIPDSIAYFEAAGIDAGEAVERSPRNRYRKVFILDPLVYQADHVRIEDSQVALRLDKALEQSYKMLGYKVTRIAAVSVQERLKLVVEEIEKESKA